MKIIDIKLKNYTVFSDMELSFVKGINVILGKNGTGKTHLLKTLYSAGISANGRITFSHKLVRTMMPLNYNISRLASRHRGNQSSNINIMAIKVASGSDKSATLSLFFNKKSKKWDAKTSGADKWETLFSNDNMVFIPAKEVLSNNYNLAAAVERGNVRFDDTYLDVLAAAKIDVSTGSNEKSKNIILKEIEHLIGGKVFYDVEKDTFFLRVHQSKQEFSLVSEGIRKLALLWTLVRNGAIDNHSVLFWDEPEANINPSSIPIIAKLLLELQRHGVQIFISTHDYFFSKYLELYRKKTDIVRFHSLYFEEKQLNYERSDRFTLLEHNSIMKTFVSLYEEEVEGAIVD